MAQAVELVCRSEGTTVVGTVTVSAGGELDAAAFHAGYAVRDRARAPLMKDVQDGTQLLCRRCFGPLYFRAADGSLVAAMPGSARAS